MKNAMGGFAAAAMLTLSAAMTSSASAQSFSESSETFEVAGEGARSNHARLEGVRVYGQGNGEERGVISVRAFDAAINAPSLPEQVKQNLRSGGQWAILSADGGVGVVGPGYECIRDRRFREFDQCGGGSELASNDPARTEHALLDGVTVFGKNDGQVRGSVSVDAYDTALASGRVPNGNKQNLRNGSQYAIIAPDGGFAIVGPGYECIKNKRFNQFPQCEVGFGARAYTDARGQRASKPAQSSAESFVEAAAGLLGLFTGRTKDAGAGESAGGEQRELHAMFNGTEVFGQDDGALRGRISVEAYDAALAAGSVPQQNKQALQTGAQFAIESRDGGLGIIGPDFECVRNSDFDGLPQCEGGSSLAAAPVVQPVTRLGNIAAPAEVPAANQSGAIAFVSRDGSAIAGSRSVFVLREVNSRQSYVVPVLGRGSETRADVFVRPGTYAVEPPPPSLTSYGSFTTQNVSTSRVTVRVGSSPTIVEFSLAAEYSPIILEVNEVSGNSVQLSWGRRADVNLTNARLVLTNGPIAATTPNGGRQVAITNPREQFSQVSGLQPGREYTFTLFTTGARGEDLPSRSVTVSTARDGADEAAFALSPNTIAPNNFRALRAQPLTSTSVRVTLPANVVRASTSKTPGINVANLSGNGCVTGTPFIVNSRVAGDNAFYGVIDVCEAGGTAIVNSDVAMSEVFAFYHLVSRGDEPAPIGVQAAASQETSTTGGASLAASAPVRLASFLGEGSSKFGLETTRFAPALAGVPGRFGLETVGFAPVSDELLDGIGVGLEHRREIWDLAAYKPIGFGTSATLPVASAMALRKVSCESSANVFFSLQPNFRAIRNVDLRLGGGGFRWNIEAGVRAGINPKMSFSGQYECALDLPGKSFQLATYPVPVNLELSPQVTATAAAEISIEGPDLSLAAGLRTNGQIGAHIDKCRLGWIGPRVPCGASFRFRQDTRPFTEFRRGDMEASLEGTLTFGAGVEANLGIGVKNALVTAKTGFALTAKPLSAQLKVSASNRACASAALGYSIAGDLVAETYVVRWGDTKRLNLFDTGFRNYPNAIWEVCTPKPSSRGGAGGNVPANAPYLASVSDYQFGYGPFISGKFTPFGPVTEVEGGKIIERNGPAPYLRMRQLKKTERRAYTDGQNVTYQPGKIVIHPGNEDGQASKVRFTAPSAGNYTVDVQFKMVDQDNSPSIDAALWTFSTVAGRVENLGRTQVRGSNSTGRLGGTYFLDAGHQINIEVDRLDRYNGDSTEVTIFIKKE